MGRRGNRAAPTAPLALLGLLTGLLACADSRRGGRVMDEEPFASGGARGTGVAGAGAVPLATPGVRAEQVPAPASRRSRPGPGRYACAADSWAAPDAPRWSNHCRSNDLVVWDCECGGRPQPSLRPTLQPGHDACADALLEHCGVDPRDPPYCDEVDLGTCWPGATTGAFVCRCGASASMVDATAEHCQAALATACGGACDGDAGSCPGQGQES